MHLEKRSPVYLFVHSTWYDMLVAAKLLPPVNAEGKLPCKDPQGATVQMVAEILDANQIHGLWIEPDSVVGWKDLQVFVPWHDVVSIATAPHLTQLFRRDSAGFIRAEKA